MAMKKRERVLVGVTGALLVVVGGAYLFRGGGKSLSELRTERDGLEKDLQKLTAQAQPGKTATEQLNLWKKRSLPSDYRKAGKLYQEWLSLLTVAKLHNAEITPMTAQTNRGIYTVLPFRIEAKGTLDELTRFLFEFYSADYLHKIRQMSSTPTKGSPELTLVMTVEALCLSGAASQDKLPEAKSKRLEHGTLDEYLKAIVRRRLEGTRYADTGGLFASYAPEPPPPPVRKKEDVVVTPPPPRGIDPSEFTYVNAIHEVDGLPEVWLFVRIEGKTLKLHEGDPFEVGTVSGKIARIRIEELNVEIEVDGGRRFRVDFGDNLHDRVELPNTPIMPDAAYDSGINSR
jgi:hypothetical protein